MAVNAVDIIKNVFVFRFPKPIAQQVNVFNLDIRTGQQFLILFLLEITGLQFLIDRSRDPLKLAFYHKQSVGDDHKYAIIGQQPF